MSDYCAICTKETRCVQPIGPQPARYLAIGEAPGKVEDATGIPFSGPTGEEWDYTYLPLAGLNRGDIFVTNVRQCRPPQNRKPSVKEIEVCGGHHLPSELEMVKPEVVFLMGATACSVADAEINLEVEHGIPRKGMLYGKEYWLVPMFHPALGLHQTSAMIEMLEDWQNVKLFVDGLQSWNTDVFPRTDYQLVETVNDVENYLKTCKTTVLGVDTESHGGVHWSTQISMYPGTGRMALAGTKALEFVNRVMWYWDEVALHNAVADLPVLPPLRRYIDTMQECYQLGNLPQGLKALGYRLFGVRMKSWEDLVMGPSKDKLLAWMIETIEREAEWPVITFQQLKTKVKETRKPNGIESALRRIMRHTVESTSYDPWDRLKGLGLEGYPIKGIANCKLEDVVQYGCRDADITLRLALELKRLRKEAEEGWDVSEEDWDKAYKMDGLGLEKDRLSSIG